MMMMVMMVSQTSSSVIVVNALFVQLKVLTVSKLTTRSYLLLHKMATELLVQSYVIAYLSCVKRCSTNENKDVLIGQVAFPI